MGFLLLAGVTLGRATSRPPLDDPPQSGQPVGLLLDPNEAAWWELTVIPGIGEVTARNVVAYRGQWSATILAEPVRRRPFVSICDLQNVHGIGPVRARQMSEYLRLEPR